MVTLRYTSETSSITTHLSDSELEEQFKARLSGENPLDFLNQISKEE